MPLKIDYKKNEKIKLVMKNTSYNLFSNVHFFVYEGEWYLCDKRHDNSIEEKLNKDNFESVLVSLLTNK